MLRNGSAYIELGADYFDKLNHVHLQRAYTKRLTQLGFHVTLEPISA